MLGGCVVVDQTQETNPGLLELSLSSSGTSFAAVGGQLGELFVCG